MLKALTERFEPTHLVVAFDNQSKKWRKELYPEYKANRVKKFPELYPQFPEIRKILDKMGIYNFDVDTMEGDDVIGSMAKTWGDMGNKVSIISGDRDILQLINSNVSVYMPTKWVTDLREYTEWNFKTEMGFEINQMIEWKSLVGDAGDNIKGVEGVGEKTATKYLAGEEIKQRLLDKITEAEKELLPLNRKLTTIVTDLQLPEVNQEFTGLHYYKAIEELTRLELIDELKDLVDLF